MKTNINRKYICTICNYLACDSSTFKRHLKTDKHVKGSSRNNKMCNTCKTLFVDNDDYNDHLNYCCYDRCATCNKQCMSLRELRHHECTKMTANFGNMNGIIEMIENVQKTIETNNKKMEKKIDERIDKNKKIIIHIIS